MIVWRLVLVILVGLIALLHACLDYLCFDLLAITLSVGLLFGFGLVVLLSVCILQ